MERRLKERLIGASVLVMLAVILIPMILDDSSRTETRITQTNIPPRPSDEFTSRIVPIRETPAPPPAAAPAAPGAAAQAETPPAGAAPAQAAETAAPSTPPPAAHKVETPPKAPSVATAGKPEAASGKSAPAAAAQPPDRVGATAWIVQLGSFTSEENANALSQKLRAAGYAAFVEPVGGGADRAFRVRVGPELLKSDAQALSDRLKTNLRLDGIVLSYP